MDESEVAAWVAPVILPNGEIRQTRFDTKEQAIQACLVFEEEREKLLSSPAATNGPHKVE